MTPRNSSPEEPAGVDPGVERARRTAPAAASAHRSGVRRSIRRATDKLSGLVGMRDGPEPAPATEPELDMYSDVGAYRAWLRDKAGVESEARDTTSFDARPDRVSGVEAGPSAPTISVIVPVFRPELWYLEKCVESVKAQVYDKWELCVCDDASGSVEIDRFLKDAAASDRRINIAFHDSNGGISRASNTALGMARGEFVALLDHDDELTPDALLLMARRAMSEPEIDVIYSDEDKLMQDGGRGFPTFKPDWSPDLLLSYPFLGHLMVIRRQLVEEVGGLRPEMDGSQDFDLMLRTTERARAIVHVPKVLYHWRMVEGSAAGDPGAKPWAYDASRRALADALVRRKVDGHVESGPFPGAYHTRRAVRTTPKVSVIIPLHDSAPMLRACVDALSVDPGHRNFEIVLIGNDTLEPEMRAVVDVLAEQPRIRLVERPGSVTRSARANAAARTCDADMLLYLEHDVVADKSGWMKALIEHAQRPEVGAVGCRLLFPDGTLEHAGIVLGMRGLAGYLMSGLPRAYAGYMGWVGVVKDWSAVSAAAMMCRRAVFEELGGFDETFSSELGDVDFCLRLRGAGYRIVSTPHAELVRHGSHLLETAASNHDVQEFLRTWIGDVRRGDPFYNENLSRFDSSCALRPVDEDRQWEVRLSVLAGSSDKNAPQ